MTLHTTRSRFSSVPPSTRSYSSQRATPARVIHTTRGPLKVKADISSVELTPVVYDEYYGCNYRPSAGRDSWSAYRLSDETLDDADDLVYASRQRDADALREVDRQMNSIFAAPKRRVDLVLARSRRFPPPRSPTLPSGLSSRFEDKAKFQPRPSGRGRRSGRSSLHKPTFTLTPVSKPLETVHEFKALAFKPPAVKGTHTTHPVVTTKIAKSTVSPRKPTKAQTRHENKMIAYESELQDLGHLPGVSGLRGRMQNVRDLSTKQKLLLDKHVPMSESRISNLECVRRAERAASAPPPPNLHKVSALRSHLREVLKRTSRK